MTKKSTLFTKLLSAFLALAVVLSIGCVPAFAAETDDAFVTEVTAEQQNARATELSTYARFYNYVDTDTFYVEGNSVSCSMSNIHTDGTRSFQVILYRVNSDGSATQVLSAYTVDGNSGNRTVAWSLVGPGTYFIRFDRDQDSYRQHIESVVIMSS